MRRILKRAALLAVVGSLVIAAVAVAMNLTDATNRTFALARWKAACGQGYWTCNALVMDGPHKQSGKTPQWKTSVVIFRRHGDSPSVQVCNLEVDLNEDGSTHSLTIFCTYALT